jgi:hypothetical protein
VSPDELAGLLLGDSAADVGVVEPVDADLLAAIRKRHVGVRILRQPTDAAPAHDLVIVAGALERSADPVALLGSATALVAPGGRLVLAVPNLTHVDVVLLLWTGRSDLPPRLRGVDPAVCSPAGLTEVLAAAGLGVVELERQVAEVFRSDVGVDPAGVPTEVRQAALRRPESTTVTWVLSLAPGAPAPDLGEQRPPIPDRTDRLIEENDYLRGRVTELAELVEQLRAAEVARPRRWWQRRS